MSYKYKLKAVFIFTLVFLLSMNLSSQEIAITEDGKEVYLKADLSELSSEKAAYIKSHPDHFVVISDRSELKNLELHGDYKGLSDEKGKIRQIYSKYEDGEISKQEAKTRMKEAEEDQEKKRNEEEFSIDKRAYKSEMEDENIEDMTGSEKRATDKEYEQLRAEEDKGLEQKQGDENIDRDKSWIKAQEMLDQGMSKEQIKKKLGLKTFPE